MTCVTTSYHGFYEVFFSNKIDFQLVTWLKSSSFGERSLVPMAMFCSQLDEKMDCPHFQIFGLNYAEIHLCICIILGSFPMSSARICNSSFSYTSTHFKFLNKFDNLYILLRTYSPLALRSEPNFCDAHFVRW